MQANSHEAAVTRSAKEEPMGLRERSKQEKRRRIKLAARQIFLEKGYEAATTREIAALAEVATGTVFVYAKDKRDLLLMIINDDLDAINEAAAAEIDHTAPLLAQLDQFFRARYEYWASEPRLARPALQETFDFLGSNAEQGEETARFYARRPMISGLLTDLLGRQQAAGQISSADRPELIASLFMTIYLTEVRRWLAQESPEVEAGMARLLQMLDLAIRGILPARA